ncbi:glycosyltransferase family 1 protein [Oceanobacillus piezotolerans]|uniref:Glycosyltransferase family 1 protein n=1 Tax=Oceanobacillus piezotolerans TaxID=2448030 RepID=A0A498DK01_9BACI|nr:glycosyltransferase family 4 protein [Oceanobacillus piezotolerans]RLL42755.1 glycosyltransferase family 1 protein [Oceanobacillus piezotolerans]
MEKKILFCATVDYHFKAFHLPYMRWFKEQGWEVEVAASGEMELPYTDRKYNIPIQRSPFRRENIVAYKMLKKIVDNYDYDIIHCHTPLGGVLARLAARGQRKNGTKVIYTAHGFHFCKGAPLANWMIYYPIERFLSKYTDTLITINQEDYQLATKHRFHAGVIEHVHGVGVDTDRFKPITEKEKIESRKSFGYGADDFLLFYAAEFNKNKNQEFLLHVLASIKEKVPSARLLLAGEGTLLEKCRQLARELGIEHMVDFLGFRKDIDAILPMCDVAVASSLREGLPVNIMEAMACGLPVVAVDNRGHRELVRNGENGYLIQRADRTHFADCILKLFHSPELQQGQQEKSLEIIHLFSVHRVSKELFSTYSSYMGDESETKNKYHRAYI